MGFISNSKILNFGFLRISSLHFLGWIQDLEKGINKVVLCRGFRVSFPGNFFKTEVLRNGIFAILRPVSML